MTLNELHALAEPALALPWGSDEQICAENTFCDAVAAMLSPAQMAHWQHFSLKATSIEIIDEGLRLAALAHSPGLTQLQRSQLAAICEICAGLPGEFYLGDDTVLTRDDLLALAAAVRK